MAEITATLTGTRPLILHSDKGANPLDPDTIAFKMLTGKRGKTTENHEEIMRAEWELGMYKTADGQPGLPGLNFEAAIRRAAMKSKKGKLVQEGVMVLDEISPVVHPGPRSMDALFKVAADVRSVVVGGKRITRTRPIFRTWKIVFTIQHDPEILDASDVMEFVSTAGKLIGIGDFRPRFGRFTAEFS